MRNIMGILILFLLLSNSSFAQQSDGLAPEATAAEVEATADGSEVPFWDIPNLEEAFINAAPTDRKDGIPVGELGVDGGDKAMILALAREIADNKHGNFDSFLVAYQGKLLFESYYAHGRINLPHPQASATKAYTSLLLGRAIQLGYLSMADLDKPLVSFLKDLDPTKFAEGVEKITLHQALTMRGGLGITKEQQEEFEKNPAALKGQGLVQTLLGHTKPITLASQRFLYGNFNPTLVMQVIDAVVPGTAKDFIKNELLEKMGITDYGWGTDISGLPEAGWKTGITSRAMVKFGKLALNKGKWNGEQLVPEAFIAKATSRILTTGDDDVFGGGKDVSNQGYGYYWWNADLKYGNKSYFSTSAQGGGGQFIVLIEALDLMVVVTAHDNDNSTLQIIAERILPAFVQNSNPTMGGINVSQDRTPVLEGPYLGQKPPGLTAIPFAPGIVNTEHRELSGFFSPDLKEFYFIRHGGSYEKHALVVFQNINNRWRESYVMPRTGRPVFAPDGNTMHLGKKFIERTETGWSDVKSLGAYFEDIRIMRLTSSSKGTYVFDEAGSEDGDGIIRYSGLINGRREAPRPFSKAINTGKFNAHPFISPDESYIIWDGDRESGYGDSDLYISFRQQDGLWGEAINLGDNINTAAWESTAFVTPDGKYLFFNRNMNKDNYENVDIYWVDAQFIEHLRP